MDDKQHPQIIPGHIGYAPDYKSDKPLGFGADVTDAASVQDARYAREKRLRLVAERAKPVLQWDREKAEAWLPGLYDALKSLES